MNLKLLFACALTALAVLVPKQSRADESPLPRPGSDPGGDLFPTPGRLTVSAGTGLPFLGIAEAGIGVGSGFAVGVIGGITPSVLTAGIRPRFRLRVGDGYSLMLVVPMLYYPGATAPGPGNIGRTSWVLARPELLFDAPLGSRWHLAGGMGLIAAASTLALANKLGGNQFVVPGYGAGEDSFAGGLWNTLCFHTSYALGPSTHLFAEGSLVLSGVVPASDVGGPPIVLTTGLQHTF